MTIRERSEFKARLEEHVQDKALWLSHELTGMLIEKGLSAKELAAKAGVPLREVRDILAGIPQKWMYQIGPAELALEAPIIVTPHQYERTLLKDPSRVIDIMNVAIEEGFLKIEVQPEPTSDFGFAGNYEPEFLQCDYSRTLEFTGD